MKILLLTIKFLSPFLFVAVCGIFCSLWFVAFSVHCGFWHSLLFQACFAISVITVIRPESRLHTTIQGPDEMFGARVTCDVKLSFPEGINVRFFFTS